MFPITRRLAAAAAAFALVSLGATLPAHAEGQLRIAE